MDDGYPKELPGGWKGLPSSFFSDIDAAVYDPDEHKIFLFKGSEVVRITGTEVDRGYPQPIDTDWKGLPGNFYTGVDAAIYRRGYMYLFKGDQYVRLSKRPVQPMYDMDKGYPSRLPGGWDLPRNLHQNIDAALAWGRSGRNYFFQGEKNIRLNDTRRDPEYTPLIAEEWKGFEAADTRKMFITLKLLHGENNFGEKTSERMCCRSPSIMNRQNNLPDCRLNNPAQLTAHPNPFTA